jgi:hypothetical protein
MKNLLAILGLPILAGLLVTGCNSPNLQNEDELAVFKKNEAFGNKMADAVESLHPKGHVLLASFVSANNLQETDGFGRITSDQVAGCLVQHGLSVVETRLRHDGTDPEVAISEEPAGEFALTRDVKKLAAEHDADIVVTGVYTYGKYNAIVAMKAIDKDGIVRRAFNYTVPATVSFDWDQHSLEKFKEHSSHAQKNMFWDPYDDMDNGSGKTDFH